MSTTMQLAFSEGDAMPQPEPGWVDVRWTVTQAGALAVLRTPVWALDGRGRESFSPGVPARLLVLEPGGFVCTTGFELRFGLPCFDRLPDGGWVVANARCRPDEHNAVVLAPGGAVLRQLCLGDGIGHLCCDGAGDIWIGYFDEGVFGNWGWGTGGKPTPIGYTGLVRFDLHGAILWEHPGGTTEAENIAECSTMNVQDEVWACTYPDHPVQRIAPPGTVRLWSTGLAGASVLAVDGSRVLLAGGHGEDVDRVALLRLEQTAARVEKVGTLPGRARPGIWPKLLGRGRYLHAFDGAAWLRLDVENAARQFAA